MVQISKGFDRSGKKKEEDWVGESVEKNYSVFVLK